MYGFPARMGVPLLAVLLLCPFTALLGQGWNTQFDLIGTRQGLPEGHVFQILEDRMGFIWIASYEGFFRYDGHRVEPMGHRTADSLSISANRVRALAEARNGNLWVGTVRGLNLMDRRTGQFRIIPFGEDVASPQAYPNIHFLHTDARDRLWIATREHLYRLDADSLKPAVIDLHEDARPISLANDREGRIWGVTGDRMLLWDESLQRFIAPAGLPVATAAGDFRKLVMDPDGGYWILGNQGIWQFDPRQRTIHRPAPYPDALILPVRALTRDESGALWLGLENGLVEWHPVNGSFHVHRSSPLHPERISSDWIHHLSRDRHGNIWIAHNHGINRFNPGLKQFHLWQPFPEEPFNFEENHVQRIIELPDGRMFFTTRRGVYWMEDYKGPLHKVQDIPYPFFIEDFLYIEKEDLLLMTYSHPGKGVFRYDRKSNSLKRFPLDPRLDSLALWRIIPRQGQPDAWWISSEAGLCLFHRHTRDTTWYYPTGEAGQTGNIIKYFCQTGDGTLWMEANTVFTRFDPGTGSFEAHPAATRQMAGRPVFRVRDIVPTRQGALWITSENGLTRFDPKKGTYRYYGPPDGIRGGEIIYAIKLDDRENVWFTTFNHIHRLDPATDRISAFHHVHGVHTSFHRTSNASTRSGHILFGGANGMIVFHPDSLQPSSRFASVVLRDLRLNNHTPLLGFLPEHLHQLELSYKENGFSFQVAALDFLPEPINEYQYRLQGFDQEWLSSNGDNRINYTNIPPGKYLLEVRASNHHGQWPDDPQWSIPIRIIPPFWEMWWFRLLSLLLAAGIGIFVLHKVRQIRKLRQDVQVAEQNARYKSRFLTNMSHEIRTPMNAIIGLNHLLLESDLNEKQKEYALTVKDSADNLLWIINDILDQARIESGQYSFRPRNAEIRELVRQVTRLFGFRAREKGLAWSVTVDDTVPDYVFLDPIRLMQVWINLLGNALKFTEQGTIGMTLESVPDANGPVLHFRVFDTGKGIAEDQLERIFDSFTQIDSDQDQAMSGTGLGLSITRELLVKQGGDIRVESEPGKGSTFHGTLPYSPGEMPSEKETSRSMTFRDGMRILLVEDTPFNQLLAVEFLKKYLPGVLVELAENGQVALEKLDQQSYDLVLMDVKMPVMDGLTATRKIRRSENPATRSVPVLGLTANAIPQQLEECRLAGMDDVVTKPLEAHDFLTKMQALTQLKRL